jgi:hypothetical protein
VDKWRECIESTKKINIPFWSIWAWAISILYPKREEGESYKEWKCRIEEETKYRKFIGEYLLDDSIDQWTKNRETKKCAYKDLTPFFPREIESTVIWSFSISIVIATRVWIGTFKKEVFSNFPEQYDYDEKYGHGK